MDTKISPIVSLDDIGSVEIILDVVLMSKVIGGVDISSNHNAYLNKNYKVYVLVYRLKLKKIISSYA